MDMSSFVPSACDHHAELVSLKNSAYAWRQMIALLSELEPGALLSTLMVIEDMFAEQSEELQARLGPIMTELRAAAIDGERLTERSQHFLGWTLGWHPLAGQQNRA